MENYRGPVLAVGLGGIGCSIVDSLAGMLPEEKKEYVAAVGIDTNTEDLCRRENIVPIKISLNGSREDVLDRYPEYRKWFPSHWRRNDRELIPDPLWPSRVYSRLALAVTVRENHDALPDLDREIDRILANCGGGDADELTVFVVGTIAGDTGSGCFLQIPFYIREYVRKTAGTGVCIYGMFIGPDIISAVMPSVISRNAAKVNAYACLKELNAFFMDSIAEKKNPDLSLEFYNGEIPYDDFYLIEDTDNTEETAVAPLEGVKQKVVRMILTMMCMPGWNAEG